MPQEIQKMLDQIENEPEPEELPTGQSNIRGEVMLAYLRGER